MAHPPQAAATRYVEAIGGLKAVIDKAQQYAEDGDWRFAAELLKHAVFAEPDDAAAKAALADVYDKLGFGAENATWRAFYLTGAQELREGITPPDLDLGGGMAAALTIEQLFDAVAIRVNGPRAAWEHIVIEWRFTDTDTTRRTTLSNGALTQTENPRTASTPDLSLGLTKPQLLGLLAGGDPDGIERIGDSGALTRVMALLDPPNPAFPIVTP